ncbi:MAG: ATP-binding protein, partial [Gemmatimonadales bacterium]
MTGSWSREQFARDQSLVLRRVAEAAPIREVLDALARLIERLDPTMKCSILLLTDDGRHLVSGASPSLPAEYNQAIDGLEIGEKVGSCGTAAFRREMVIAADIATDPRWEAYRSVALPHGLRSCWSTPVFGNSGRVLGTFAVYHDEPHHPTDSQLALVREATDVARIAMEQWKNERTLRQSEERYRKLVSATAQAVWIFTADGTMVGPHSTWPAFTGVTAEDSGGVGWLRSIHPDDREATRQAWSRAQATRTAYEIEHRVLRADGEWRTMTGHAVPIFEEDGSIREWIGAHTDVTEQRALESKMRQAQKLESLGVMAGGIAHDFNNLLVGILANAGLALMDVLGDSPARESLVAIEAAASRAADLVSQLLAYTGRGNILVQPVDLPRLVLEMGDLMATAITRSATIDYDFAANVQPIRADATQIRQVVMNLITNAAEALGASGGAIRVSVANTDGGGEMPEGRYVVLEVADSGVGMDPATQARMFEPFFTTKFPGRGLGLAAVQGIVRSHGGTIRISSIPGEGTTFRV